MQTGKITGVFAIHNWTLSSNGNHTTVHVEESLEGILPKLFKKQFQKNLDQGMAKSLMELKSACEKKNI